MKYTLYESKGLIIGLGAWDEVKIPNYGRLVSIIGYADSNIDGTKFRTYIFFGLRIIKEVI